MTEEKEVLSKAMVVFDEARSITVLNAEDYQRAGEFLRKIKDHRKMIQDWFKPLKEAAAKAHREIVQKEQAALKPLQYAESMVGATMMAWKKEEERKAEEEARRLREEARKRDEEMRLAEAIKAEVDGKPKLAEKILSEPIEEPVIAVVPRTPKISGLTERVTWDYEIIDESMIPRDYLTPDHKKIYSMVRFMKDKTNIPGIRVFKQSQIVGARY